MRMDLPALLGRGHAVVCARYETTDPYAITLRFPEAVCPEEWLIGRELLTEALRAGRAGLGDVKVTARGDLVVLGFTSPDGTGTAVFRRDDVAELLAQTHQIVRPGTESQFLDWSDPDLPGVAL
jgi:sporulation and cell division protein SsgA